MEQAAATGELRGGLVSGWRRRDSPVRVRKRRGGEVVRGKRNGGGGGEWRGRGGEKKRQGGEKELKEFKRPVHLCPQHHIDNLLCTILHKPHQSRLSKHWMDTYTEHTSMAAGWLLHTRTRDAMGQTHTHYLG